MNNSEWRETIERHIAEYAGVWFKNPTVLETPPAPTDGDDERYFYLWHRPYDSSQSYPSGVNRIVNSAAQGVLPGYALTRRPDDPLVGQLQAMRPVDATGFSRTFVIF